MVKSKITGPQGCVPFQYHHSSTTAYRVPLQHTTTYRSCIHHSSLFFKFTGRGQQHVFFEMADVEKLGRQLATVL